MAERKRYQRKVVSDRLMYLASNAQLRYYNGIIEGNYETIRRLQLGKSKLLSPEDQVKLAVLQSQKWAAIDKIIKLERIQKKYYDPAKAPRTVGRWVADVEIKAITQDEITFTYCWRWQREDMQQLP